MMLLRTLIVYKNSDYAIHFAFKIQKKYAHFTFQNSQIVDNHAFFNPYVEKINIPFTFSDITI